MALRARQFRFLASILFLTAVSCSKKMETSEIKKEFSPADLNIEVHENQLSEVQKKAYDLFSQEGSFKTEEFNHTLTMAVLDQQRREFIDSEESANLTSDEIPSAAEFLARIVVGFLNRDAANIFELKTSYESQLEEQLQKPLVYNRDHVSVFSATTLGKAQCYSGTMILEILRRQKNYQEYLNSNPVVIFESGHVLAGYMELKNGKWNLVGVESTVAGEGRKLYGPVSGLRGVRVVAANYFFAIEAVKFSIGNEQEVFENALVLTANAYGMDLNKLEATISNPLRKMGATEQLTVEEGTAQILNQSMFSFGVSKNVPPGDVTRDQVDTLPPNMIGALNPAQSAIWILEFEEDRDAEIREPSVMNCDEFNLPRINTSFWVASGPLPADLANGDLTRLKRWVCQSHPSNVFNEYYYGLKPLHWATLYEDLGFMAWLLDHGADPNAKSYGVFDRWNLSGNFTPLQIAILTGNKSAVTLLLEKGADPNNLSRQSTTTPHMR